MIAAESFLSVRPTGGFNLIMADPPWLFENYSEKGEEKNATAHYDCMPLDQIKALPVGLLAARDCLLWLWATNPMLPHAIETLTAWGFAFKTAGHWAKTTRHGKQAFGTGYILRGAGEPFLIGTIGAPKTTRSTRSVLIAPLPKEHSRKPPEAFDMAEKLMPGARRLELFSRENRPGWTSWGDEKGKFNSIEGGANA